MLAGAIWALSNNRTQFLVGGAPVSAGVRIQDHLEPYDFVHEDAVESPEQVWTEFERQNELSASVRAQFPRTAEHPMVAMLVCMDARIDTQHLVEVRRGIGALQQHLLSGIGQGEGSRGRERSLSDPALAEEEKRSRLVQQSRERHSLE